MIVGSFLWGNPKTNNIASEIQEDTTDSDRHITEHSVTPGSNIIIHSNQSLNPNSSSMGGWSHMRPHDMRDAAHTDIDLMRE